MNFKLIAADGLNISLTAVATMYIVMCMVPAIPEYLGINIVASGVVVASFLAVAILARPHMERLAFSARVKHAALKARKAKTNR